MYSFYISYIYNVFKTCFVHSSVRVSYSFPSDSRICLFSAACAKCSIQSTLVASWECIIEGFWIEISPFKCWSVCAAAVRAKPGTQPELGQARIVRFKLASDNSGMRHIPREAPAILPDPCVHARDDADGPEQTAPRQRASHADRGLNRAYFFVGFPLLLRFSLHELYSPCKGFSKVCIIHLKAFKGSI